MSVPLHQTLVPFEAPTRLTGFPAARRLVGRSAQVDDVVERIVRGERLVTVLGPPGIGKTSVAIAVAQALSARLPAWFCDLGSRTTRDALCAAVMSAFGESADQSDAVGAALATLGPALLVLDNFEQLVTVSETVLGWSRRAPEVVMLVTSRERMAVDTESVVELAPLQVPTTSRDIHTSPAFELFELRAEAAGARASEDVDAIIDIVRTLDGIPLAIELAAARTRLMSPADLARRLREGADVLTLGKRAPVRHRTLSDAIAWSWNLLSETERCALTSCATFSGSFTVAAAERVIGAALGDVGEAMPTLVALRDKSLLHMDDENRLRMFLSIRAFAHARRSEHEAAFENASAAHARVFALVAAAFVRSRILLPSPEPHTLGQARRDIDNLIAAHAYLDNAPPAGASWRLRTEIASALAFMGHTAAIAFLRARLLDQAGVKAGDPVEETDAAGSDDELRAIASLALDSALILEGSFEEAFRTANTVIDDTTLPAFIRAAALLRVGTQRRELGDGAEARRAHERASALLADQPPSILAAMNDACRGRLACDRREHDLARTLNEDAATMCERLGELWLAALPRANMAQLEQEAGRLERAEHILERAIERFRAAGEPHYEGFYAAICAGLYLEWGKLELARAWYQAAQGPIASTARPFSGVVLHGGWAVLEAIEGDRDAAQRQLEQARRSMARCPGRVARTLLEIHSATVETALRTHDTSRRTQPAFAFAELAEGGAAHDNLDTRFALRLLNQVQARLGHHLVVHDNAKRVVLDGTTIDLSRRATLRRLVLALAEAHATVPPCPLDTAGLFAAGWPGQSIQADSAATRVRVAVATLRKLGLRDVLVTGDEGYSFDLRMRIDRDD